MAAGVVKWFNPTKGYGFIQPLSRTSHRHFASGVGSPHPEALVLVCMRSRVQVQETPRRGYVAGVFRCRCGISWTEADMAHLQTDGAQVFSRWQQ